MLDDSRPGLADLNMIIDLVTDHMDGNDLSEDVFRSLWSARTDLCRARDDIETTAGAEV